MKLFSRQNLEDVAEDEPVFLIRASDAEGPNLLRKYAFLLRARHRADGLAAEIEAFADELFEWQHAEGNSAPPPPSEPDVVDVEDRLAGHVEDGFEGARELEVEELLETPEPELES